MHATFSVGSAPRYDEPIFHRTSHTSPVVAAIFAALGALCLVGGAAFDAVALFIPGLILLFVAAILCINREAGSSPTYIHHERPHTTFVPYIHHSPPRAVFVNSYSSRTSGLGFTRPLGFPSDSRPYSSILGGTRSSNPLRG